MSKILFNVSPSPKRNSGRNKKIYFEFRFHTNLITAKPLPKAGRKALMTAWQEKIGVGKKNMTLRG
jgi:hypothetical protein